MEATTHPMMQIAIDATDISSQYPDDVRDFVRTLALEKGLIESVGDKSGLKHGSYYSLVLDLGTVRKAPLELPEWCPIMAMRQCFNNAYELAVENPGLTYVEGYAMHSVLPTPHAWVVDEDDRIIDPTWTGILEEDETMHYAYYAGVKFETNFLIRRSIETGWVSMFMNDWERNTEILRHGLVTDGDFVIGIGEL